MTFTNPCDAAAHLREHDIDVIISDMMMPEMDGIELLSVAREAQPDVPRIVLTGYADKDRALEIDSAEGQGARVSLVLPRSATAQKA